MKTKKKELGQFLTSESIASFMADLAYLQHAQTILDPAVGEGVFIKALAQSGLANAQYTAYDIDPAMTALCTKSIRLDADYRNEDYLLSHTDLHPDIIICNPPYNKFQEIPRRKEYIALFKEKYNFELSGYSNLCVYFLMKSLFELNENGKCIYILPYEFLNTGYGERIKEYFIRTKFLKTIFKFNSNISLFDDAVTTSCILVFEKTEHADVEFVLIDDTREAECRQFTKTKKYKYHELDHQKKWNVYFDFSTTTPSRHLIPFSSIARVKRGIATGANDFFALKKEQIDGLNLSTEALLKCICKSADVKKLIFQEADFKKLYDSNKRVYLFNGAKASTQSDLQYIQYGESKEYHKSYLNAHRAPWYSVENKEIAPIWISVFHRASLKVVRNETEAKNLTTFHGIYLQDRYNNEKFINVFFCYLLTPICQSILAECKREYGDGLDKFEPNDLNNAMVLDLSLLTDGDICRILNCYDLLKAENANRTEILNQLNSIFMTYMR